MHSASALLRSLALARVVVRPTSRTATVAIPRERVTDELLARLRRFRPEALASFGRAERAGCRVCSARARVLTPSSCARISAPARGARRPKWPASRTKLSQLC